MDSHNTWESSAFTGVARVVRPTQRFFSSDRISDGTVPGLYERVLRGERENDQKANLVCAS